MKLPSDRLQPKKPQARAHRRMEASVSALRPTGAASRSLRHGRGIAIVLAIMLLLASALLAAAVVPASAAAGESVQFNISGRGYGHGIGMSQYGAYGYARKGWKWDAIIKHYYTGVSIGKVSNKVIRVLLATGQVSVRLSSTSDYTLSSGSSTSTISGGSQAVITVSGSGCSVSAAGQTWSAGSAVTFSPGSSLLRLANRNQNGYINTANMHYRGSLRVINQGGSLTIVNHVPLEQYLYGVVPREVSSGWPAEALKAQAVAARSFGAQHLSSSGLFDVYCTTRSQAYGGADGEAASTTAAVDATRGCVPTYNGKPIGAYFFSTSGGYTENVENIWAGSAVAYLKGVEDPYDTYSPYHIWPENPIRRSAATMTKQLGSSYAAPGSLRTIYVTQRGVSPRVVQAYVVGTKGSRSTTGAILRVRLGLRDTWFDVRTLSMSPYSAKTIVVTYGASLTLSGRTYPALGSGDSLIVRYYANGKWRSLGVPAANMVAKTQSLGGGRKAKYVQYSCAVAPRKKTVYMFAVGTARSPKVTVAVRSKAALAAPQTAAAVGQQSLFTATVAPASLAGTRVSLQLKKSGGWTSVAQAALGSDGTVKLPWTPTTNGTFSLRLAVPSAKGLVAARSAVVKVVVGGTASPSPSASAK